MPYCSSVQNTETPIDRCKHLAFWRVCRKTSKGETLISHGFTLFSLASLRLARRLRSGEIAQRELKESRPSTTTARLEEILTPQWQADRGESERLSAEERGAAIRRSATQSQAKVPSVAHPIAGNKRYAAANKRR
jgi:hypothetical protein